MAVSDLSVLLIEDSDIWMYIYKETLEEVGIANPDCAVNESEASEYIQNHKYDIIIADTLDADGNPMGPNSIKKTRKLNQNPRVVASSNNPDYLKRYWKDVPYDYFLNKRDYDRHKLIEFIKATVE